MRVISILAILLISVGLIPSLSMAKVTNYALQNELAELLDEAPREVRNQWGLLESLGWTVQVEDRSGSPIKIVKGDLKKLADWQSLNLVDCDYLCISVQKNSGLSKKKLAQQILAMLKDLVDDPVNARAFRLKYADKVKDAVPKFSEKFGWAQDKEEDALGTGFTRYFERHNLIEAEIQRLRLGDDFIDERSVFASWDLKDNYSASKALRSLVRTRHTSGCQIALGAYIQYALVDTYDNDKVFDSVHKNIFLNNGLFRPSTLLPDVSSDYSGRELWDESAGLLVGESGYMQASFNEKIENQNYAGENFIITDVSPAAFEWLKQNKGWGHKHLSYKQTETLLEDYEDNELGKISDPRLMDTTGLSQQMLLFWDLFSELRKSSKKTPNELKTLLYQNKTSVLTGKSQRLYQEIKALLNLPVMKEFFLWGHPGGEMSLAHWLIYLVAINPDTPFTIFSYKYDFTGKIWKAYKEAFLNYKLNCRGLVPQLPKAS